MQYDDCIDVVKRIINKQKGEPDTADTQDNTDSASPDEDEIDIDSFMVINRTPQYLKESTLSYWKNQQVALLNQTDINDEQDFAHQVTKVHKSTKIRAKRIQPTLSSMATPQWNAQRKRIPITNITFCLPIEPSKFWISSFFGPRKKPSGVVSRKKKSSGKWGFHSGIDMAAQRGTVVKSAAAGTVEQAGYHSGYGNTVVIIHDKVYKTRYAHLDTIHVKVGQKVTQNQKIGTVGDTGFTVKVGKDASHLHFEVYERGKQVNPLAYLMA